MVDEGTNISEFESFTLEDAGGEKAPPKEAPKEEASQPSEPPDSSSEAAPPPMEKKESAPEPQESDSKGGKLETSLDREPNASPAARALALEWGVPLKAVKGTGPGGRITKSDIEKYNLTGGPAPGPTAAAAGPTYTDVPAS